MAINFFWIWKNLNWIWIWIWIKLNLNLKFDVKEDNNSSVNRSWYARGLYRLHGLRCPLSEKAIKLNHSLTRRVQVASNIFLPMQEWLKGETAHFVKCQNLANVFLQLIIWTHPCLCFYSSWALTCVERGSVRKCRESSRHSVKHRLPTSRHVGQSYWK